MEDRETARMRKYGESKTTGIMMATVPHVTSGLGLRKFQADGFLLTRVYEADQAVGFTCTVVDWRMAFDVAFVGTVEHDVCLKLVHAGRERIFKTFVPFMVV